VETLAVGPRPGDVVGGRYRIDALIGGGGFGAVYRATQLNLGRAVAIKFLHSGLFAAEGAHERFCREAQLAQQLKHPNTVRVYDFGRTESGLPYIVWEYLEGQSLDGLVAREGAQPPARVVRIASQVLKALMEAHTLGIVHRDIKPANLFVSNFFGEPDFIKVLDFGVAKVLKGREVGRGPETSTSALVGSPIYMAPEQLVRAKDAGATADMWSLGTVLYELLAGAPPFRAETFGALVSQIMEGEAVPIRRVRPDVPARLEAVIHRCLERDPKRRFLSVRELGMALAPFGSEAARASLTEIQYAFADETSKRVTSEPDLSAALGAMMGLAKTAAAPSSWDLETARRRKISDRAAAQLTGIRRSRVVFMGLAAAVLVLGIGAVVGYFIGAL
jgi:eukaryotic-like serine/threonine-protein kinase